MARSSMASRCRVRGLAAKPETEVVENIHPTEATYQPGFPATCSPASTGTSDLACLRRGVCGDIHIWTQIYCTQVQYT